MADAIELRLAAVKAEAEELRAELDTLDVDLESVEDEETRTATADRIGEIEARAVELAEKRAELEARLERRLKLAESTRDLPTVPAVGPPRDVITDRVGDPYDPDLAARARLPQASGEVRDAAMKAVSDTPEWELTDANKARLTERIRRNPHVARLVIGHNSETYKRAFTKALQGNHYLMDPDEQAAVQRAMSLTDGEGGFGVPTPLDPTLIVTGDGSANPFRQISRVVDVVTDTWQGPAAGPTSFSWDAEAAEVSDDASTWTQPSVTVYKGAGFVPMSIEISGDYPNLMGDLAMLFAEGKDNLEATAFATGTGSAQPFGIVTAIDGTGNDISSATTDVFAAVDVESVHETLGPKYRSRATWVANIAIHNDIRAFGSTDNRFTVDWTADNIPRLFGRPIVESSAMDGSITALAENNVLVFGDFSRYYVIADRAGFSVELIPHLFATANNLPSGQRGVYAWWRVGADSVNDDAFVLLNVT